MLRTFVVVTALSCFVSSVVARAPQESGADKAAAAASPAVHVEIEPQAWPSDGAVIDQARNGKAPLAVAGSIRSDRAFVLAGRIPTDADPRPLDFREIKLLPPGAYRLLVDFGAAGLTVAIDDHPAPTRDDLTFGSDARGGIALRPLGSPAAATAPTLRVDASKPGVLSARWGPFGGDFELGTLPWQATEPLPFGGPTATFGVAGVDVGESVWAFDAAPVSDRSDRPAGPLAEVIQIDDAGRLTLVGGTTTWSWKISVTLDPKSPRITFQNVDSRRPRAKESVAKLEAEMKAAEGYLKALREGEESPQRTKAIARAEQRVLALTAELNAARARTTPPATMRDTIEMPMRATVAQKPMRSLAVAAAKQHDGVRLQILARNGTFEVDLKPADFELSTKR